MGSGLENSILMWRFTVCPNGRNKIEFSRPDPILGDCVRTEIFLKDSPVLVDDERHDAAIPILRRDRDECKAAAQFTLLYIVARASTCASSPSG
jgi:hypothetical protein